MNYYFDATALVKLYVKEDGTHTIRELIDTAQRIALAPVTYAEVVSALRRLRSSGVIDLDTYISMLDELDGDWYILEKVPINPVHHEQVRRLATELQGQLPHLSGLEAIHLAAALTMHDNPKAVTFVTSNKQLIGAAELYQFTILNPEAGMPS